MLNRKHTDNRMYAANDQIGTLTYIHSHLARLLV